MRVAHQIRSLSKVFSQVKSQKDTFNSQLADSKSVKSYQKLDLSSKQKSNIQIQQVLEDESVITNKLLKIKQLYLKQKVPKSNTLSQEVLSYLQQNEKLFYNFLLKNCEISFETKQQIIQSLYFDPRFVALKFNGSRLTSLLTSFISTQIDQKQDQVLGLTQQIANNSNQSNKKPFTDKLIQRLIDSNLPENLELAKKIASYHFQNIQNLTTQELIDRAQRVLGFLIYEHKILQKKFRYSSDKLFIDQNTLLLKFIEEVERRIEKGQFNKEEFLRLLFLGSEGHRREVLYFRLFRHFSPAVIKFINQNFLAQNSSEVDLWRVAYSYAMDNHEQDMRIVYGSFLHNLIDKIARDQVLYDMKLMNKESLRNVVRSMGSLLTTSDSVLKILKFFNYTILQQIQNQPFNSKKIFDSISIFIQTAVNLRFYEDFDFEKEILPLLDFVSKVVNHNDTSSVYYFLSILKGLAKAQSYYHNQNRLDVWNQFFDKGLTQVIQQNLNCLGQYSYVAQIASFDLKVIIDLPEYNDVEILRKLKSSQKDNNFNLHNQVKRMLTELQVEYQEEVPVGVLSVDFVLPKYKVAIELDGPSHFLISKDGSLKLSGTSQAKQRNLAQSGQFTHIFSAVGNLTKAGIPSVDEIIEKIEQIVKQ